jgi:pilus assembly protein Flp/PilA
MDRILNTLRSSLLCMSNPERGATATEYVIMVTLIAVAIIMAVTALGVATTGLFESAVNRMP